MDYLRRGDRLDETRIVVFDVADPRAHAPAGHFIGRVRGKQGLELQHARRPGLRLEHHRLAVVKLGAQFVRR